MIVFFISIPLMLLVYYYLNSASISALSFNFLLQYFDFSQVPGIFGNQQAHYLDVIKQMLTRCLNDTRNYEVQTEAVKAMTAFLSANDNSPNLLAQFKDLIPPLVQVRI